MPSPKEDFMAEKKVTVTLTTEELLALKQLAKSPEQSTAAPFKESAEAMHAYYDEPVAIYLHPYGNREYLTAVVNGVTYQVKRGVSMRVPRRVARVIRQAEENYRKALVFDRRLIAQG